MPTVITVDCPSCASSFPVDPAKIPEGGARTQCTACNAFFAVDRPQEDLPLLEVGEPLYTDETGTGEEEVLADFEVEGDWDALATSGLGETEIEAGTDHDVELDDLEVTVVEEDTAELQEAMEPLAAMEAGEPEDGHPDAEAEPDVEAEGAQAEEPEPEFQPEPAPEPAPEPPQGFRMGRRDPHEKAQRLARVLISDMITYNPDRHARGLEAGTLREEFHEEIDKSWAEYVEQVGRELAESTPYWTDALNDILARGEPLF